MNTAGLSPVAENRWEDGDWLVMAAQKGVEGSVTKLGKQDCDDPAEVMAFFKDWGEAFP
jgi:hypothetical protein